MPEPGYRATGRLLFGLLVIAVGVLFTLDNFGLANAHEVLRWWPALLVVYGLLRLTGFSRRRPAWVGLGYVVAGAWLLLKEAGVVHQSLLSLWPLLLIMLGISVIQGGMRVGVFRRRGRGLIFGAMAGRSAERLKDRVEQVREHIESIPGLDETSATFRVDVFMSSITRQVTAQELTGGQVIAALGGADIDLRSARMAAGQATLDLNLVMGGVNLFVPEDWAVEFKGTSIMGSVEDHSRRPAGEPRGRLLIDGFVLMSSVDIKN